MSPRELDEDDVRIRPGKGSRPRTRTRPKHESASGASVVTVDRGRYRLRTDDDVLVTAVRARELGRRAVVVGDRVGVVGDLSGGPDALCRVVRVEERTSLLRRTPDDTDPIERPVVANADLLVVVTALADPVPRPRLVDRCLVAAYDGGLEPLLCLTKSDLADPAELLALYTPLGVRAVVTGPGDKDAGVDELRALLAGRVSVLFGQSGVGKSTLVNRLVPDAFRAVGDVTGVGKGRHTSSSAVALPLPGGGTVVDTPGVRSFGLGAVTPAGVLAAFPDLAEEAELCPPGCAHRTGATGCALDALVAGGGATGARLVSLRRLLDALGGTDQAETDDVPR
ncbi:MAG: ribosome small subunit-dependent GTPase A [Mycobacteriales bacterium]|nr:ribosome small subunit-dependent GTPase A [Mycobacteriales bacterium]